MRTFLAALTALLLGASLTLAPTVGWTQTSAPPAPDTQKAPEAPKATDQPSGTTTQQPGGSVSGSASGTVTVPPTAQDKPATPAPDPAKPGTTAQDRPSTATTPEGRVPGTPADRVDDGTFFGMSRTAAIVLGLVILGIIVALVAMSRRDRDVIETHTERDVRVYDRERDVYDDRERPRKVS